MNNFINPLPPVLYLRDLAHSSILKKVYVVLSKTKSLFNKDISELPNIQNTVRRYLAKEPKLANIPVTIKPNFPNAFYNLKSKSFTIGLFNSSILAHECEHAINTMDSPVYSNVLMASKVLSAMTNLASKVALPAAIAVPDITKNLGITPAKAQDYLKYLMVAQGVASAPVLYEEGKANLNAILSSPNKLDYTKTLLPSYASYVLSAGIPIAAILAAKNILNSNSENNSENVK